MPRYKQINRETGEEIGIVEDVEHFLPDLPAQASDQAIMGRKEPGWKSKLKQTREGWQLPDTGEIVPEGFYIVNTRIGYQIFDPKTFQNNFIRIIE